MMQTVTDFTYPQSKAQAAGKQFITIMLETFTKQWRTRGRVFTLAARVPSPHHLGANPLFTSHKRYKIEPLTKKYYGFLEKDAQKSGLFRYAVTFFGNCGFWALHSGISDCSWSKVTKNICNLLGFFDLMCAPSWALSSTLCMFRGLQLDPEVRKSVWNQNTWREWRT